MDIAVRRLAPAYDHGVQPVHQGAERKKVQSALGTDLKPIVHPENPFLKRHKCSKTCVVEALNDHKNHKTAPYGHGSVGSAYHTLYVDDETRPPRPVQLVWKNLPRG